MSEAVSHSNQKSNAQTLCREAKSLGGSFLLPAVRWCCFRAAHIKRASIPYRMNILPTDAEINTLKITLKTEPKGSSIKVISKNENKGNFRLLLVNLVYVKMSFPWLFFPCICGFFLFFSSILFEPKITLHTHPVPTHPFTARHLPAVLYLYCWESPKQHERV